jgi:hypothetical protein
VNTEYGIDGLPTASDLLVIDLDTNLVTVVERE